MRNSIILGFPKLSIYLPMFAGQSQITFSKENVPKVFSDVATGLICLLFANDYNFG